MPRAQKFRKTAQHPGSGSEPLRPVAAEPVAAERCSQRGSVLAVVMLGTVAVVGVTTAMLSMALSSSRATNESQEVLRCAYAADGALNAALSEIFALDDPTGDGVGAIGVDSPAQLLATDGSVLAEYRTIVTQVEDRVEVLAVAAVPSFDNPTVYKASQGYVLAIPDSVLSPPSSAVSIVGPLAEPYFPGMGSNNLLIDGGDRPAFTFTNESAYERSMDYFGDRMDRNSIDGSEFVGAETSTHWHDTLGDLTLPMKHSEEAFIDAGSSI